MLTTATMKGIAHLFNTISGTNLSLDVDLHWTGYGDLLHEGFGNGFPGYGAGGGELDTRFAHAIGTVTDETTNYTPDPSAEDLFGPDSTEIRRAKSSGVYLNFP